MKAIILVGGEGTRMRPLTHHLPKPFLPIANVPFLCRQIQWLQKYGVTQVILSLGYLSDAFEDYFRENPINGVQIDCVVEPEPLGTAGAIKFALDDHVGEDVLVCNGDVFTDLDIQSLVEFHKSRPAIATIALTYVDDPSAFGVVPTHENGEVIAFVEKPPKASAPSHWINAGIYILSPAFLDLIPADLNVSIERETFPIALRNGAMFAMASDSYWLDIGTPGEYLRAHNDYLSNLDSNTSELELRGLKLVAPNLYSDGIVQIGENLIVNSTSIVGDGTVIGDNCTLDAATLGPRCTIENNVVLDSCVLFSGVKVCENSKIVQSVLGELCEVGSQSSISAESLIGFHEKINTNASFEGERIGSVV